MLASFPRLMARVAVSILLVAGSPVSSFAQIPVASSARTIPTEVEQSEGRITQIIARAGRSLPQRQAESRRQQARPGS